MADPRQRHPRDQGDGWFADTTCIDSDGHRPSSPLAGTRGCDVAHQLTPGLVEASFRG